MKYLVDGEKYETEEMYLTPRQILEFAGLNPINHYLVLLRTFQGSVIRRDSYHDKPEAQIFMKDKMEFITLYTGPCTNG